MTAKVGCCGYPVSAKRYREVLQVVELNKTFYEYPKDSSLEKLRKDSAQNFEFTVKANQEISHRHRLKVDQAAEPFNKMKRICKILQAKIMVIQTPASFGPDQLEDAYDFFRKIERGDLTIVWETRGDMWRDKEVQSRLTKLLGEVDVPHVTDPLRTMHAYVSDVAYFRLHGLGRRMYYYQYTDEELRQIYDRIKPFQDSNLETYVLFNNLSMFEDAKRFQHYLQNQEFPSLSSGAALDTVKAVIERTRYPVTKSVLIDRLGWRVVELGEGKQIRLEELLKNIPSKRFADAAEVIKEMEFESSP